MSIKLASGLDDFGRAHWLEGLVLLLFTACSWGLNWPVMKFLLTELPPFTMRAVSGGLGLLIAVAIALWRRESLHLPRSQVLNVIVFAMLNYGVFGLLTVLALYWMRASEAVVITYTLPIWTMMLAWPILGERPNPPGIIGMILAIGGIAWLVGADEIRFRATMLPGVACGFLAAFCFGLGAVIAKRRPLALPPVAGVAWQIAFGSLPQLGLALFEHPHLLRVTPLAWAGFAYIAVFPVTVAYLAWFRALSLLPASTSSIAVLLAPLVGVVSSAVLLGDPLGVRQVGALAVTLGGIGLAALPARYKPLVRIARGSA
jgi:probable blue pigment (indigoidine) exporter